MIYDMENFMKACVDAYKKIIPGGGKLRAVATPFIDEGTSPSGEFDRTQRWLQCTFCCGRYPAETFTEGKGDKVTPKGASG